jgi:hypothetical protein
MTANQWGRYIDGVWHPYNRTHWFCTCVNPWVDAIDVCVVCHRKPWVLSAG